jgi:hypothetical protein
LGAALSNSVAGLVVDAVGYSAAFLFLAGCAIVAFLTFWLGLPETRNWQVHVLSGSSVVVLALVVAAVPLDRSRRRCSGWSVPHGGLGCFAARRRL